MSGAAASPADRARHPAARARGDHLVGLARRMVEQAEVAGPHRALAIAARAVRGRRGRSVAAFAAALGLAEQFVADLEDGWVALGEVPAPLAVLSELIAVADALTVPDDHACADGRNGGIRVDAPARVGRCGELPCAVAWRGA